jgi:hypothetical protein
MTEPPAEPPPEDVPPGAPVEPLWLHIHVNEPWDFERENGVSSMTGTTTDHADPDNIEWEVALDGSFLLFEEPFDRVLVGPRYIGERLDRVVDDFVTAAIRIATLTQSEDGESSEWHFVMSGTLAHQRDE